MVLPDLNFFNSIWANYLKFHVLNMHFYGDSTMPCARKFYLIWMNYTDIDTSEIREKVPLLSCVDKDLTTSGIMTYLQLQCYSKQAPLSTWVWSMSDLIKSNNF